MRREGEEGGGEDKTLDERARERERRERDERREERGCGRLGDDDEHCTGKNNTGTKEMEKGPPTRKETDEPEAEREEKEKRLVREVLKPTDDVLFSGFFFFFPPFCLSCVHHDGCGGFFVLCFIPIRVFSRDLKRKQTVL